MTSAPIRPPFAYYGGKQRLAAAIAAMLPPHTHYVEPYAGGLAVLLAKPPTRLETVNDLDGDLMHFWRILRDRPHELARACALTPHSRAERELGLDRPDDLDDVERARRIWVCVAEGRTGTLRRTGWRFDTADFANVSMPNRLDSYVRRMDSVAHRLRGVSLECRDALDVVAAYGQGRRTLLYVDPPYLGSTRNRNYRNEMGSDADHRGKLSASSRQNRLAAALKEWGAIRRTVYACRYLSDETYRRKIGRQLNKGESMHALRRDLHFAGLGKMTRHHHEQQTEQAWCLTVVTNAIICWMTEYLGLAVDARSAAGQPIDDAVLAHISPAHSEPVHFFGSIPIDVDKELAQLDAIGYRPLRNLET